MSRISPEAPVPVVHVESESLRLGGAANVFNNILALGGKADLCGVIGSDESRPDTAEGIGTTAVGRGGVVIDQDRPTTRKSRVIAHNQQIVRYDVERTGGTEAAMQRRILRYVESRLRELSCRGRLGLCQRGRDRRADGGIGHDSRLCGKFPWSSIQKSNILLLQGGDGHHAEPSWRRRKRPACMATTIKPSTKPGRRSGSDWDANAVLITRGEKGMSVFEGMERPGIFRRRRGRSTMSPVPAIP